MEKKEDLVEMEFPHSIIEEEFIFCKKSVEPPQIQRKCVQNIKNWLTIVSFFLAPFAIYPSHPGRLRNPIFEFGGAINKANISYEDKF